MCIVHDPSGRDGRSKTQWGRPNHRSGATPFQIGQ
jgi:hypothetical protein